MKAYVWINGPYPWLFSENAPLYMIPKSSKDTASPLSSVFVYYNNRATIKDILLHLTGFRKRRLRPWFEINGDRRLFEGQDLANICCLGLLYLLLCVESIAQKRHYSVNRVATPACSSVFVPGSGLFNGLLVRSVLSPLALGIWE